MSAVTPYVMVDDATVFRAFLEQVFDAQVPTVVPLPSDPGRIMHAEARIGESSLYFADSGAAGERCLRSPQEPVHVQLWSTVPDPEAAHERALAAGARSAAPVGVQDDGSRMGAFVDPFGTLWWVTAPA
ncbi:VOC family protein [Nocardia sp. NPDC050712]|uniref:VOC family protein n=1 Tax=Nocardia sp. NPDC050712 TaxID=3155518 RepID=UPI00340FE5DF